MACKISGSNKHVSANRLCFYISDCTDPNTVFEVTKNVRYTWMSLELKAHESWANQ